MPVSLAHVMDTLEAVGRVGSNPDGSITRLAYTPEYDGAADKLLGRMSDAGLEAWIDPVGNVIGRMDGQNPQAPALLIGSHLDTVREGGLYDGALGVAAALACVRAMREDGFIPERPIYVVAFTAEEGLGELGGTFGSRAMMGQIAVDETLAAQIAPYGLTPADVEHAKWIYGPIGSYVELHIEQGDYLVSLGLPVGVVTGIVGIRRYRVVAEGESNHAGTTQMARRRDALVAMCGLVSDIYRLALATDEHLVATVGRLDVFPGNANVIPGRVEAVLEVRHMDGTVMDRFLEAVRRRAGREPMADFTFEPIVAKAETACDPHLQSLLAAACEAEGTAAVKLPSGAGHDGSALGKVAPIGMLFVASEGGISHSGREFTRPEAIEMALRVLYRALVQIDRNPVDGVKAPSHTEV